MTREHKLLKYPPTRALLFRVAKVLSIIFYDPPCGSNLPSGKLVSAPLITHRPISVVCRFCSTARSRLGRYLSPSRIRSVQLPSPLPKANLPRLAQPQEVHPIANAVHDDDDAAVVDFNVVGHVGVVGSGRYIERRLLGSLRVADVPRAHAGVEVSSERQLAIVRIAEVLFGRMGAEALATQAVVAARVFLTRLRIDPQRR